MAIALGDDLTLNFKVGAEQVDRLYLGNALIWPQAPIDDFSASEGLVGVLRVTWTDNNYPLPIMYDLYENSVRIYTDIKSGDELDASSGTANYFVRAIYEGGHGFNSNEDSGTVLSGIAPGTISNFSASTNQQLAIQFWWTNTTGDPTPTYDLYQSGSLLRSNVVSGHKETMPAGSKSFYVRAKNGEGYANSNSATGTALAIPVIPPSGSVTYSTAGTHTFTVPSGVSKITMCMVGGGGAGAGTQYTRDDFQPSAGGGKAGASRTDTHNVSAGQQITVTVGKGGVAYAQGGGGGHHNGAAGFPSGWGGIVANGGAGGIASHLYLGAGDGHQGISGGGLSGCAGSNNDGAYSRFTVTSVWTGFGGQGSSAGRGGNGLATQSGGSAGSGTKGSGGGGAACPLTIVATPGNGGAGYIKISWG